MSLLSQAVDELIECEADSLFIEKLRAALIDPDVRADFWDSADRMIDRLVVEIGQRRPCYKDFRDSEGA